MKDEMTVGIMGGLVNNGNLGCQALTYSLVSELETISFNMNVSFRYIIFEYDQSEEGKLQICSEFGIANERIELAPIGRFYFYTPKKALGSLLKWKQNSVMVGFVKRCDVVIDITQGDSFTDIYGLYRFYTLTSVKWLVEKMHKPLILAPQTYGPFNDNKVKKFAKGVIEKSELVLSRDRESTDYLKTFADVDVHTVTDLAFSLPYHKNDNRFSATENRIRIGINPSGLLSNSKTEGTSLNNKIVADYDLLMMKLIDYLKLHEEYEIYLIPHVGDEAHICLPNIDGVKYYKAFKNPVEAKTVISNMDVFIGARMHATIGAFSSGVPTIPIAYSRKFEGLFGTLGYNHVVDITKLNTEQALEKIISDIQNYKSLAVEVRQGMEIAEQLKENFRRTLEDTLRNIKEKY